MLEYVEEVVGFSLHRALSRTEITFPLAAVAGLSLASLIAVMVHHDIPQMPAFCVAVVAYVSNHAGIRAGLLTAALSALACNFFFAQGLHLGFGVVTLCEGSSILAQFLVALAAAPRRFKLLGNYDQLRINEFNGSRGCRLPFTAQKERGTGLHRTGRRYWFIPAPSGDWLADFQVGLEYARIFLEHVRSGHNCPEACWILGDMMEECASRPPGQRMSGIEAGFMQGIMSANMVI